MLAFDDEMFKTEFFLSETNGSSTSFDLGNSPNTEAVMDQWDDLLFGNSGIDLIGSHLQTSVSRSDDVDQEDSDGELADLLTSDDPHRTDSRDGNGLMNESAVTGNCSEEFIPVFTADRSNRRDHDYNVTSADEGEHDDSDDDDDDHMSNDQEDVVPQKRSGLKRQAAAAAVAAVKSSTSRSAATTAAAATGTPATGKRMGLRQQPTRKRCYSTSSITSLDLASPQPASSRGPATKRRKPSGDSDIFRSGADKCMTRNAIAARENREKKKALMRDLEDRVEQQQEQIDHLMQEKLVRDKSLAALAEEVTYLRGVLKNSSEIATVINSIRKAPGITDVRTSFGLDLRSTPRGKKIQDENETPATTTAGKNRLKNPVPVPSVKSVGSEKRGICVHVNNGAVSLEFCAHCSQKAARSGLK